MLLFKYYQFNKNKLKKREKEKRVIKKQYRFIKTLFQFKKYKKRKIGIYTQ